MEYLTPLFALNAIAGPLAVILVIANKLLAEYEDVSINVNDGEEEFVTEGGTTLLDALKDNGYDIRAACGGQGSCGFCKVQVEEGGGPVLPTEEPMLTREELMDGYRLSCQVKVREDTRVQVPDYLTTVRNIVENELYDPSRSWSFSIADRGFGTRDSQRVETELEERKVVQVDEIIENYNSNGNGKGALLPLLQEINNSFNYLPEPVMARVSERMDIPVSRIYQLATFYNAFNLEPQGEYTIKVCLGTACHVKGGGSIIENFEDRLGIERGQTTEDRTFSLKGVRCLGTCGLAPVVMVNENVHGEMTPKQVPEIIEQYREEKSNEPIGS